MKQKSGAVLLMIAIAVLVIARFAQAECQAPDEKPKCCCVGPEEQPPQHNDCADTCRVYAAGAGPTCAKANGDEIVVQPGFVPAKCFTDVDFPSSVICKRFCQGVQVNLKKCTGPHTCVVGQPPSQQPGWECKWENTGETSMVEVLYCESGSSMCSTQNQACP